MVSVLFLKTHHGASTSPVGRQLGSFSFNHHNNDLNYVNTRMGNKIEVYKRWKIKFQIMAKSFPFFNTFYFRYGCHFTWVNSCFMAKNDMVAHWATRLHILVAKHCFLVVPGVRTPDLSSPAAPNHRSLTLMQLHWSATLGNHLFLAPRQNCHH